MLNGLLLLHLVGFALLASGTVLGSLLGALGRRTNSVAEHRVYAALLGRVGPLSGLGGLTLVLSGTGLVSYTGVGFGAAWISIAYTMWIVAFGTAIVLSRPHAAAVGAAVAAMSDRTESPDLAALYASGKGRLAARIHELTFTVSLLVMVFKPGA